MGKTDARCAWARAGSEAELAYHDEEWGVPSFDERHLFEMLVLEGAQAGLSWRTILDKREGYRRAFAGFDPERVARFRASRVQKLLADPGIVRNRLKVTSAVTNAKAYLELADEPGGAVGFLWSFVGGRPIQNRRRSAREVPSETAEAREMSRALKRRGFRFVGPTICYAFMQAVGMVNDHEVACPRHRALAKGPARRRKA